MATKYKVKSKTTKANGKVDVVCEIPIDVVIPDFEASHKDKDIDDKFDAWILKFKADNVKVKDVLTAKIDELKKKKEAVK